MIKHEATRPNHKIFSECITMQPKAQSGIIRPVGQLWGWHSCPPFCTVCVCICVSKVLFLVHPSLPALQWLYSFLVLQRTGLMTSSRDMKRLCPPATRILQPWVCVAVCFFLSCKRMITAPSFLLTYSLRKQNVLAHAV